jgi:hypothetical protein
MQSQKKLIFLYPNYPPISKMASISLYDAVKSLLIKLPTDSTAVEWNPVEDLMGPFVYMTSVDTNWHVSFGEHGIVFCIARLVYLVIRKSNGGISIYRTSDDGYHLFDGPVAFTTAVRFIDLLERKFHAQITREELLDIISPDLWA